MLVGREVKVSHILEGIEEALRVGLKLVKVNVCVVRVINQVALTLWTGKYLQKVFAYHA